jgi:hypothetical protein
MHELSGLWSFFYLFHENSGKLQTQWHRQLNPMAMATLSRGYLVGGLVNSTLRAFFGSVLGSSKA